MAQINAFFALLLLLSYLVPYIAPESFMAIWLPGPCLSFVVAYKRHIPGRLDSAEEALCAVAVARYIGRMEPCGKSHAADPVVQKRDARANYPNELQYAVNKAQ
ncbi:MAG: hypothetical protein U5L09_00300 [Bacteroidales bacterium]|nr:hypothetical protein [Bacteroidales bacterium]